MTIEWKIGNYYRTRGGQKVYLYGIRKNGCLAIETSTNNYILSPTGAFYAPEENCVCDEDIVSEWREPHVHECEVWVREAESAYGVPSDIFNFPVGSWSTKQLSESRKFKVRVEEVLE